MVWNTLNKLKFISAIYFFFKVVLSHDFGGVYFVFYFVFASLDDGGTSFPNGFYVIILSYVLILDEEGLNFVRLLLQQMRRQAVKSIVVCLFHHHIAVVVVIIFVNRKVAINSKFVRYLT